MAKRALKQSPKTVSAPTTRALEHGENAAGVAGKKPGFCFTPDDDLAFALGFPYMKYLVDDTQDPRAVAERLLIHGYPYQQVSYGREAAVRLVRALCLPSAFEIAEGGPVLRPDATVALDRNDPLTPDEARTCILTLFGDEASLPPSAPMTYLMMEALMGPDLVAGVICEGLESIPIERWISHGHLQKESIDMLCIMSLRLSPADREQTLGRLRELRAWVVREASHDFDIESAKRDLAFPPDPAAPMGSAADRAAWRDEAIRHRNLRSRIDLARGDVKECGFEVIDGAEVVDPPRPVVQAAPEVVRAARLQGRSEPWYTLADPRLVFLGGEEVYRVELDLWHRYTHPTPPGEAQEIILDRFGRIRSPVSVELALDMSVRSRAKTHAKAWLSAHLDYARPVLASLAKSSSRLAKAAADFLGKLPS